MAIPLRGTGSRARGTTSTVPGARKGIRSIPGVPKRTEDKVVPWLDRKADLGGSSPTKELSEEERRAVEAIRSGKSLEEALALIPEEEPKD